MSRIRRVMDWCVHTSSCGGLLVGPTSREAGSHMVMASNCIGWNPSPSVDHPQRQEPTALLPGGVLLVASGPAFSITPEQEQHLETKHARVALTVARRQGLPVDYEAPHHSARTRRHRQVDTGILPIV